MTDVAARQREQPSLVRLAGLCLIGLHALVVAGTLFTEAGSNGVRANVLLGSLLAFWAGCLVVMARCGPSSGKTTVALIAALLVLAVDPLGPVMGVGTEIDAKASVVVLLCLLVSLVHAWVRRTRADL